MILYMYKLLGGVSKFRIFRLLKGILQDEKKLAYISRVVNSNTPLMAARVV